MCLHMNQNAHMACEIVIYALLLKGKDFSRSHAVLYTSEVVSDIRPIC